MNLENDIPNHAGAYHGIQTKKQSGAEEKYLTFYYKYLDYVDELKLSNAELGMLFRAMFEYKSSATVPVFENPIITGLWVAVKWDIDNPEDIVRVDVPLNVKSKGKIHG